MNREEFYKELYFKEFERKRELNNSLQIPIGILSGLIAALYFLITKFDYKYSCLNSMIFGIIIIAAIVFLSISAFHLIKALANFHDGYPYAYLADSKDLHKFYKELKEYYEAIGEEGKTELEFCEYVLEEMIKNTDKNQKNNKSKSYHRYKCQSHLVNSFLLISISLFPFGFNIAMKPKIKEIVPVEIKSKINSDELINRIDSLILKYIDMADNDKKPQKPTPPPSQLIKEGQNPKPQKPEKPTKPGKK